MQKDDRFNPYDIVLETPYTLQLTLNRFHRIMTFFITVVLPIFIAAMLGISMYFMMIDNETDKVWILALVLIAPAMLLFAPWWPRICMEKGRIEVQRKKLFKNKTFVYTITAESKLDVQWKRGYKTAAWEFVLVNEVGKRTVMFAMPDAPFNRRLVEKENMLAALKNYSQPQ